MRYLIFHKTDFGEKKTDLNFISPKECDNLHEVIIYLSDKELDNYIIFSESSVDSDLINQIKSYIRKVVDDFEKGGSKIIDEF